MKREKYDAIILNEYNSMFSYITDIETYEILHMTTSAMELYGIKSDEDYIGKKCYQLLQGLDAPCKFCNNAQLKVGEYYCWEHFNEILQRWLSVNDTLVTVEGRQYRLERAHDITEHKEKLKRLSDRMKIDDLLLECTHLILMEEDMEKAIQTFLEKLGRFCRAKRAYIFEFDTKNECIHNNYEWCSKAVLAEKKKAQNISAETAKWWMDQLKQADEYPINTLNEETDSDECRILKVQGIQKILAPMYEGKEIIGVLGVDDPTEDSQNRVLLRASANLLMEELQKHRMIKKLEQMSYRDLLTGIYNRNKYIDVLEAYEVCIPTSLGVVFADVNGLKNVNDTYGHKYGDMILKKVADILVEHMEGRVYRIGGDEFVILYENISEENFKKKIKVLKAQLDREDYCEVALGSEWKTGQYNVKELLANADQKMYDEKQKYYRDVLRGNKRSKVGVLGIVAREIKENRFEVVYQPQVDIETEEIIGAEALVRKIAPDGSMIVPDKFIPYYELEGIIRYIDLFVLETVCKKMQEWNQKGKFLKISINFSRVTLMEEGIVETINKICEEYNISPLDITIEVIESVGKMQIKQLQKVVNDFRKSGFSIALDDYGSKYSNLALLSTIDFHTVKIDRALVQEIESNKNSQVIMNSTIQMCRSLNDTHTLAEGIETKRQAELLSDYHCEYGQGFYYSKPLSVKEFERVAKLN